MTAIPDEELPLIDMTGVDENATGGFDWVPDGRYTCYVCNHEVIKKENGMKVGLPVTFMIIEGPYTNKKPGEYFNIRHSNAKTVEIAVQKLKQLTIATGQDGNVALTNAVMGNWYGKPIVIDFVTERSKDPKYGDSSRAKKIYHPNSVPMDGAIPALAGVPAPPPAQTTAPAAATAAPPPAAQAPQAPPPQPAAAAPPPQPAAAPPPPQPAPQPAPAPAAAQAVQPEQVAAPTPPAAPQAAAPPPAPMPNGAAPPPPPPPGQTPAEGDIPF